MQNNLITVPISNLDLNLFKSSIWTGSSELGVVNVISQMKIVAIFVMRIRWTAFLECSQIVYCVPRAQSGPF